MSFDPLKEGDDEVIGGESSQIGERAESILNSPASGYSLMPIIDLSFSDEKEGAGLLAITGSETQEVDPAIAGSQMDLTMDVCKAGM